MCLFPFLLAVANLCYCVLPLAFDSLKKGIGSTDFKPIVLVMSPLIALMKDQVRAMQERNVSALYAGDLDEKTECEVCLGKYQLIFISPESLLSSNLWHDVLLSPVFQENLVGVIVDMAHL